MFAHLTLVTDEQTKSITDKNALKCDKSIVKNLVLNAKAMLTVKDYGKRIPIMY